MAIALSIDNCSHSFFGHLTKIQGSWETLLVFPSVLFADFIKITDKKTELQGKSKSRYKHYVFE